MVKLAVFAAVLAMAHSACDKAPCLNGGSCLDVGVSDYLCYCPSGFEGLNCEIPSKTNETCLDGPQCQNGGFCVQNNTDYFCWCPEGYGGEFCEYLTTTTTLVDPCYFSPCKNGGSCYSYYYPDFGFNYYCVCPSTTTGSECETIIDNGSNSKSIFNFDFFFSLFNYINQSSS